MKINKIISFILTIIILLFSFCPLAFAEVDNNQIENNNISGFGWESSDLIQSVTDNYVYFNTVYSTDSNDYEEGIFYSLTLKPKTIYEFNIDYRQYLMSNIETEIYIWYYDNFQEKIDFALINGSNSYNGTATFSFHNDSNYQGGAVLFIVFNRNANTYVSSGSYFKVNSIEFGEKESKEGNILKRIYNFIINLPATFQNFFTDLKNGISSFFTDLKDNLSNWFDNLKTSIGEFFGNLSDNLSEFFTKLKNWLLWFNADGSGSYVNPFDNIDDDVDDDLESNIIKLANYINDNTQSVSDSLAKIGSVFLVFDSFVVGIPLVLSLIIFAFFIHILKRLLGF